MILKIGVTGHRFFLHEETVRQEVRKHLYQLKKSASDFEIISPLADGADMLVAEEAMEILDAKLTVVLPFELHEYKNTVIEKKRFNNLLLKSQNINVLLEEGSLNDVIKEQQYYLCGKLIVDQCNVLIALYDGLPELGLGGTAQIVDYAYSKQKYIIRIDIKR